MLPAAPARFSTITGWPSGAARRSATSRAKMSVEPAGANGTTMRSGFAGYCAHAISAASARATSSSLMRPIYLGLCLAVLAGAALGQEFPNRPVRLVVPWPPAGNVDITARTVAPAFGDALGQQVIVENRAGAGGRIGTEAVVRSPADGYTLLLGSTATARPGPAGVQTLSFGP